ncbi:YihY family inner membrane protein [bacterium]|nr:YihY family inner membrane protein [bacterium]
MTVREFIDDNLFLRAMALTFVTLLSVVPMLGIIFSMFKMFGGGEWFMEYIRPFLLRTLAPGSGPVVAQRIEELLLTKGGSAVGSISLIFLVVTVYVIFSAIESTFNLIWRSNSRAGALNRIPLYWGLVSIIPVLVISSLALTTYLKALPFVHQAVKHVGFAESIFSRTLPVLMIMLGFFLLYRFLPNASVKTRSAIVGAITAGIVYEIVKMGFIFYTGKLVKFDIFYGSLAIIPLLMIWVSLSWVVVLMGVEVCYVTQHFNLLRIRRKHVLISRDQEDALAYQILTQVTFAFRGQRKPVMLEEWSEIYTMPPGNVRAIVERLKRGGFIDINGKNKNEIRLLKDPDYITINDVNKVLSAEDLTEWDWPDDSSWRKVQEWLKLKKDSGTLDQLVRIIDSESKAVE